MRQITLRSRSNIHHNDDSTLSRDSTDAAASLIDNKSITPVINKSQNENKENVVCYNKNDLRTSPDNLDKKIANYRKKYFKILPAKQNVYSGIHEDMIKIYDSYVNRKNNVILIDLTLDED